MHVVLIAHYFPPINSSGAKRAESLCKYFRALGHDVTVLTTRKRRSDGEFTEQVPYGIHLIELDSFGRERRSTDTGGSFEPMYVGRPSWRRRLKDLVMAAFGQIPDPRLPFAIALLSPWLAKGAKQAFSRADVVIGTTPPWPMVLAAVFCKLRFGTRCVLDYRDHFSECHEMPGGRLAKLVERFLDRRLANAADHVVCISDPMADYYRAFSPRVSTILNGYDEEILNRARYSREVNADGLVRIRYMGIISPGRIPHNILRAVMQLSSERPELFNRLRFEFFGNAALIQESLERHYPTIAPAFFFYDPVPYIESLKKIVEADFLLFSETSSKTTTSARGILTTKLFEYIGSGRPILADISPETLAGELIVSAGNSHVVGLSTGLFYESMSSPSFYERSPDRVSPLAKSVSRQSQALKYANLLNSVIT
jgi:glycosyltransferase involved in cell wall biosynthesis